MQDRGNPLKLNWKVLLQLVFLGFVGIFLANYLLYVAIEYTSAEAAAAVHPFLPVLVALIAIIFGDGAGGLKEESRTGEDSGHPGKLHWSPGGHFLYWPGTNPEKRP